MVWSELPSSYRMEDKLTGGGWSKELLEDAVAEVQAGGDAP